MSWRWQVASKWTLSVSCDPEPPTDNKGLVQIAQAEVLKFEEYFQRPDRGGTPLSKMEREVMTSYVFAKLTEQV